MKWNISCSFSSISQTFHLVLNFIYLLFFRWWKQKTLVVRPLFSSGRFYIVALFLRRNLRLDVNFVSYKNDYCLRNSFIPSEAVARMCSVKKVFLEISQISQENTCATVSFLIKLKASAWKEALCFPVNFWIFSEHLCLQNTYGGCFCSMELAFLTQPTVSFLLPLVYPSTHTLWVKLISVIQMK